MGQLSLRAEAVLEAVEWHLEAEAESAEGDLLILVNLARQLLHDDLYPMLDDLDGAQRMLLRQQQSAPATLTSSLASFTHSDFAALSHMKV